MRKRVVMGDSYSSKFCDKMSEEDEFEDEVDEESE